MGSKHDLTEYAYAVEVVRDFPLIEKKLDNLYKDLYKYRDYLCVSHVLDAVADSKEMVTRQYKHYKKVLETKGQDER